VSAGGRVFYRARIALLAPRARRARAPEVLVIVNDASAMSLAIGEAYRRQRGVPAQNVVHLQVPLGDDAALQTPRTSGSTAPGYNARVRDRSRASCARTTERPDPDPRHHQGRPAARSRRPSPACRSGAPHRRGRRGARGAVLAARRARGHRGRRQSLLPLEPAVRRVAQRYPTRRCAISSRASTGYADARIRTRACRATSPRCSRTPWRRTRRDLGDRREPAPVERLPARQRRDLRPAAAALGALGATLLHDTAPEFVGESTDRGLCLVGQQRREHPAAPYFGEIGGRRDPGRFAPRSIAVTIVSTDARTFTRTPEPYGQSLAADLIHAVSRACGARRRAAARRRRRGR
jgi:hypothetical protein